MFTLNCKGKFLSLENPVVMGILNVTPDSFYEGNLDKGLSGILHIAEKMIAAGAGIIDIGGQSTRPGSERIDADEEIKYEYNGADTLPAKLFSKYTSISSGSSLYDTSVLTYSGGMVARDSFFSAPDYVVAEFNKLSENRYKAFYKINNGIGGQVIDTAYINLTYQNGNIIKEVDSLWLPGGSGSWIVTSMDLMYDNKPNPLRKISIPYPAPFNQFWLSGIGVAPLTNRSMNNEISEVNNMGTFLELFSYQYGPTGLPKIVRDNNGLKFYYFYKVL